MRNHNYKKIFWATTMALALVIIILNYGGFFSQKKDSLQLTENFGYQMDDLFISAIIPSEINTSFEMNTTKKWGITGNSKSSFLDFEQQVERPMDINAVFVRWEEPFPYQLADSQKTLVIFWEPIDIELNQIESGNYDSYIKQFALQTKSYQGPVILIPLPEMNGNWDSWGGSVLDNTPEKTILVFKYIHNFFSEIEDVKFGWDVNHISVPDTSENAISKYYPGTEYVDYVGVNGFNFGEPWQSYSDIFSPALEQLKIYEKPIYIFSMACAQGPEKSAWIKDALLKIKSDPSIIGFVWFNEEKEQNWLVSSDPESMIAFKSSLIEE